MVNPSTSDRFVSVIRGLYERGTTRKTKSKGDNVPQQTNDYKRVAAPVCSIKGREVTAKDLI